jgi:biopolymer transport protein ExbD
MARHTRAQPPEEDEPKLDISSLIDATFLLLIYFLVTTTIQPRESDLTMNLPAAQRSEKPPDIEPKFIKIDATGAIYVGVGAAQIPMDSDPGVREVPLLSADLESYSEQSKSLQSTPVVQLYVDGGATQQRVIDVLNALSGAQITTVTFTDLLDQ